jgi:NAD(P)-dependent dehydrogenase (short-subunit alcohol dehydrogenase family)
LERGLYRVMKALIIGSGKGLGLNVANELNNRGWEVETISRQGTCTVEWETVNQSTLEKFLRQLGKVDLVFFYQNYPALSKESYTDDLDLAELWKLEKNWAQGYFVSSILPYHIIKTVQCSKVVWMLSESSTNHNSSTFAHGDYVGHKYQNYVTMRNFSLNTKGCYFGLTPELSQDLEMPAEQTVDFILNTPDVLLNGSVFYLDGTPVPSFSIFN